MAPFCCILHIKLTDLPESVFDNRFCENRVIVITHSSIVPSELYYYVYFQFYKETLNTSEDNGHEEAEIDDSSPNHQEEETPTNGEVISADDDVEMKELPTEEIKDGEEQSPSMSCVVVAHTSLFQIIYPIMKVIFENHWHYHKFTGLY